MKDLLERMKRDLANEEDRYAYADSVSNAFLTAQIKALRDERRLTQERLAELVGTQQSGISRWQNSGYSSCKVETLRKFARAFGVRLRITFEEFGTLTEEITGFDDARLLPHRFEQDPVLNGQRQPGRRRQRRKSRLPSPSPKHRINRGNQTPRRPPLHEIVSSNNEHVRELERSIATKQNAASMALSSAGSMPATGT